jgi:hypothetical protein
MRFEERDYQTRKGRRVTNFVTVIFEDLQYKLHKH